MPSAAKRRKSGKKKKQIQPNYHSSPTLQGNDDLKPHYERESYGGETNSVTSQNHCDQHSLVEEEEEKETDSSSIGLVLPANHKQMEEYANDKLEDTQKVVFKPDDDSVTITVTDESSEFVKETHDGDDSSSGSSSSDDESRPVQKSPKSVDLVIIEEDKVVFDSVIESPPHVDSVEPVVSLSEEPTQVVEDPAGNSVVADVIELESKEIEEKVILFSDENNGFSPVKDLVLGVIEETTLPASDENNGFSPVVTDLVSGGIEETTLLASYENNEFSLVVTDSVSGGIEETTLLASDENNGFSPVVTDSVSGGIGETKLPASDENNGFSPVETDSVSKGIEETKLPDTDENIGESSATVDLASKENVNNFSQPSDVPGVDTGNGGEPSNEFVIPESTEYQPIIAVTPQALQRTSWRSCCGLFDVLRRSNR